MCWLVRTSKDLGGRPPLASRCISLSWLFFHGVNTGSNPVGDAKSFQKFKSAGSFFPGTARMKSLLVAPVRFPGQQTFAHQRSVIFWSQRSLPMWVPSCRSDYLNCDIACNIITRCQLLMFSI